MGNNYVGYGNSLMSRFMSTPLHKRDNLCGEIAVLQGIRVNLIEEAKRQPARTTTKRVKKPTAAKVNQLSKLLQTMSPEQIAKLKRSLTDV